MKKLFFLFISLSLLPMITFASFEQADTIPEESKYHFWFSVGGLYCFSGDFHSLLGGQLDLNFSVNQRHFIKLKGYGCYATDLESSLFSEDTSKSNRLISIQNLSVLYGTGLFKTNCFSIITSAGLSCGTALYQGRYLYTNGCSGSGWGPCWDNAVYDYDDYSYIGMPLNISFMITSPFIGLSIDLYANIHKHPDYGVTLNTHFGKIRDKK
jgi:hypothetical protein